MRCDFALNDDDPVVFVPALGVLLVLVAIEVRARVLHRREMARIRAEYDRTRREGR